MVAGACGRGVISSCGFQERKQVDDCDPVQSLKAPMPHFLQLSSTSQMIPPSGDQAFQSCPMGTFHIQTKFNNTLARSHTVSKT